MQLFHPLVGVFDSGIGGLNVLDACAARCPGACYLYFGDNAHAPYGSRTQGEIVSLTRRAMRLFSRLGADAAVLACNTATAAAAERMRAEFAFPVVGVEPAVLPAAARCARVLVLATPHTASSRRLASLVARARGCRVEVRACPGLASAVEGAGGDFASLDLSAHLPRVSCDGVVLGCTHYCFLRDRISAFYRAPVFDGCDGTARRLAALLGPGCACGQGDVTTRPAPIGTDDHFPENPNKFSDFCLKRGKNGKKTVIFFLGEGKMTNLIQYEQMFLLQRP